MVKTEYIDGYNEWQTLASGRNISILSIPLFICGKGGLRDWPTYLLQGFTEVCQCKAPHFFKITRHHLFWLQFWKKANAGFVTYCWGSISWGKMFQSYLSSLLASVRNIKLLKSLVHSFMRTCLHYNIFSQLYSFLHFLCINHTHSWLSHLYSYILSLSLLSIKNTLPIFLFFQIIIFHYPFRCLMPLYVPSPFSFRPYLW